MNPAGLLFVSPVGSPPGFPLIWGGGGLQESQLKCLSYFFFLIFLFKIGNENKRAKQVKIVTNSFSPKPHKSRNPIHDSDWSSRLPCLLIRRHHTRSLRRFTTCLSYSQGLRADWRQKHKSRCIFQSALVAPQ